MVRYWVKGDGGWGCWYERGIELLLGRGRAQIRDGEIDAGAGTMLFHHVADPQHAHGKAQQLLLGEWSRQHDGRRGAR